jgi:hypothetical protein
MSNSDAQVSRTLVIDSPQKFYKLIKDYEIKSLYLLPFQDRMDLFFDGCPCEAEENWDQSVVEYKKLSKKDLTFIKEIVGCDKILFYLEETLLFEL